MMAHNPLTRVRNSAYDGAPTTVHIVDDDKAVRDSLRFLLESEGHCVRTYDGGEILLAATLPLYGCILTDVRMPDLDGLSLQSKLAERGSLLPIIVMSGHRDVPTVVRAMRAGAVDFLEKPWGDDEMLEAVGRALDANKRTVAAAASTAEASERLERLTRREVEVLELLVTGMSSKEIAGQLGTSPRTIDVHRGRITHKLEARTMPDLVHLVLAARADASGA